MNGLIQFSHESGILIIEILLEKLDLFETPHVLADVEDALKHSPSEAVIIDLKNVHTIDSSGIGFLLAIRNSLSKQKVTLNVVCNSDTVSHIFRLTKVNHLIPMYKTREEAMVSVEK